MDYQQLYQQKLMTAEEAVDCVRDGDWIEFGYAACTPVALDRALAKRMPQLRDINLRGSILLWKPEIFNIPDPAGHLTWNSCHMTGIDRPLVKEGFCFHVPVRYSELPRYCREHPCRVFMAQVTPMDQHGYFNFGLNASHLNAAMEHAEVILVEVNENMPRCLGGRREGVHISQVDGIVLGDNPPIAEMLPGGDPRWGLSPAGHRRDAQCGGLPDRRERPEGPGRPHGNVCRRLCGPDPGG